MSKSVILNSKIQKNSRSHSSSQLMHDYEAGSPSKEKLRPQNLIGAGGSVLIPGERTGSKELGDAYGGALTVTREPATAKGIGPRNESHASSTYSADIQSQQANEQNILNSVRSIRSNIVKSAINTDRSKKDSKLAQSIIRIGTGGDNQDHVSTPASLKHTIDKASCSNFQLVLQDIDREGQKRQDKSQLGRSYNSENRAMSAAAAISKI